LPLLIPTLRSLPIRIMVRELRVRIRVRVRVRVGVRVRVRVSIAFQTLAFSRTLRPSHLTFNTRHITRFSLQFSGNLTAIQEHTPHANIARTTPVSSSSSTAMARPRLWVRLRRSVYSHRRTFHAHPLLPAAPNTANTVKIPLKVPLQFRYICVRPC